MTDNRSNHDWILDAIASATLIERLDLISKEIIQVDQESGVDYTLDEVGMDQIRAAYGAKMRELKGVK